MNPALMTSPPVLLRSRNRPSCVMTIETRPAAFLQAREHGACPFEEGDHLGLVLRFSELLLSSVEFNFPVHPADEK